MTQIKRLSMAILLALTLWNPAFAQATKCPHADVPQTKPSKIDIDTLMATIAIIENDHGETAYKISDKLRTRLTNIFSETKVTSKMEQFYAMLFALQEASALPWGRMHSVSGKPVRDLLIQSGVFPNENFPKMIEKVVFRQSSLTPFYEVHFAKEEVEFPINQGAGFRAWQHGKCQHLQSIIFESPFSFYLRYKKNGNLQVYKFLGAMTRGDFGTRGLLDIDLNFVALEQVTFIQDSVLGYVTARVAPREFEVNQHSWLLKVVTNLFADTTKQAIDW